MSESKKQRRGDEEKFITRDELNEQSKIINHRIDKITERIDDTKNTISETKSKMIDFSNSLGDITEEIGKMVKFSNNHAHISNDFNKDDYVTNEKWKHYFIGSVTINIIFFILIIILINILA